MWGRETDWRQGIREILSRRERNTVVREGFRPSGVLVPVFRKAGEYYVVLTKRSDDVVYHKGQVSFPGGACEEGDADLAATALRETCEEVGIRPDDVEVLGALDDQATLSSKFVITPFVGAIPCPYTFTVNCREVEALIEAPVGALLGPGCYSPQTPDSDGTLHPWGYYCYGGHQITGITARILKQFLDLVFS